MTRAELSRAIVAAVRAAVATGELTVTVPEEAPLTWAKNGRTGSPLPLRLAGQAGRPAREVAGIIAKRLAAEPGIQKVAVKDPGFLLIEEAAPGAVVAAIVAAGGAYGRVELPAGPTWPDRPRRFGNPGFEVRLAYARAVATRRWAQDLGVRAAEAAGLEHVCEVRLLHALREFPERARQAERESDPARVRRHLERIADAYHEVYERCSALPQGDEEPTRKHGARLTLAEAVRIVLNNGLIMLGETPRETI
ncbi:MAG: anticodon binding domain protein [Actinomycetia bacterium]|nr:anticodon binding domain protein [Actinomycetes bacterium]